MGLFDRLRGNRRTGSSRQQLGRDLAHLRAWAGQRRGVEAYVEPRTSVTPTTVVLVAHDGEWTRRRLDGPRSAYQLGRELGIPVYDVALVGYPRRMREYTSRQAAQRRARGLD
ncbi:oxidoreductase [Gandjariella thermophila]|uniref:Uncharacterized protein n=1 Tax=Gandjariella thermophila TaxID=1931992 RepID=A0A4D4J1B0_9PSEU|nr:oxidoreductase [Gandjariella thermophila]GDY30415.1 hypothetical protein GTS_20480 [Gandjariella thermophila]